MRIFDFNRDMGEFLNNKIAVNCATERDAEVFFQHLKNEYNIRWATGDNLNNTRWVDYGEETCYNYASYFKGLQYLHIDYFNDRKCYQVLQFKSSTSIPVNNYENRDLDLEINEQNMKLFLNDEIAVNCRTLQEARQFLNFIKNKYNKTWADRDELETTNWHHHEEGTCYVLNSDGIRYGEEEVCSNTYVVVPLNFLILEHSVNNSIKRDSSIEINKNNLELFLNGEFVINCTTKREAAILFEILSEKNIEWITGKNLSDTHWERYEEETCYFYDKTRYRNGLSYGDIRCFEDELRAIMSFNFLLTQQKTDTKIEEKQNPKEKTGKNRKITIIGDQ